MPMLKKVTHFARKVRGRKIERQTVFCSKGGGDRWNHNDNHKAFRPLLGVWLYAIENDPTFTSILTCLKIDYYVKRFVFFFVEKNQK